MPTLVYEMAGRFFVRHSVLPCDLTLAIYRYYVGLFVITSWLLILFEDARYNVIRREAADTWGQVLRSVQEVVFSFSNNQPDALIIQILFCYKSLHISGIFSTHHQEFSTVYSTVVSFMQVFGDRFQAESGWNCSSILTLFGSRHQKPAWNLPVPNVH